MSNEANLDELARRYLELWQDQMSALAADPVFAEALSRLFNAMGLTGAPGDVGGGGGGDGGRDGARGEQRRAARTGSCPGAVVGSVRVPHPRALATTS
jgi:hypothetical protein